MRINFNQKLFQLNGIPLYDADNGDGETKQATMRGVIINALQFPDNNDSGEKKMEKWLLAKKVYESDGEVEIKIEEAALIKKAVGKGYGPAVVGPIYSILEKVR